MHGLRRPSRPFPGLLLLLVAMTGGLVAGCAAPSRVGEPAATPAARRATIEAVSTWEARGRIAVQASTVNPSGGAPGSGQGSGQGNFIWRQDGERTVVRVSGPFGAGAYEIQWEPTRLTVLSGRGEETAEYTGPDAAGRFLEEQLGWGVPVANARYWLLGLAGPDGAPVETLDSRGLPSVLSQDGWDVTYGEFRPEGTVALPRKLTLSGTSGRIRLVIDKWQIQWRDF